MSEKEEIIEYRKVKPDLPLETPRDATIAATAASHKQYVKCKVVVANDKVTDDVGGSGCDIGGAELVKGESRIKSFLGGLRLGCAAPGRQMASGMKTGGSKHTAGSAFKKVKPVSLATESDDEEAAWQQ